jgi:enoyl-CoA hydratase/carnithine racemase
VDILRRWLRASGFGLDHVMNVTDVDDRIIQNAVAHGKPIEEYTATYTQAFLDDCASLRLERPEKLVRATEHINDMVAAIEKLGETGHTYTSEGSVYFRIASFPQYGKLSHTDFSGIIAGARVDTDKYEKDNARDFALWKAPKPGETSKKPSMRARLHFDGKTFFTQCQELLLCQKITIAQAHGFLLGAGLNFFMNCDLLIASEDCKLGHVEERLGLGGATITPMMILRCGYTRAMELCLTGKMIDAKEAKRAGLINRVVPADKLEQEVNELAEGLALLDRVGRTNLKLMPDVFHMNIEDPSIAGELVRHVDKVGYIHLADSNRLAPGWGHTDFADIIGRLKQAGYRGWFAVEILPKPDPQSAARQAVQFLRPLLAG